MGNMPTKRRKVLLKAFSVICNTFATMKMLMVCLGNICRSPLAEGILRHQAQSHGLNWEVDSAGTGNWHVNEPPHHLSIKVASMNGIDISTQRARQFCKEDFERFDKIWVMDNSNYAEVKRMAGSYWQEEKIDLLLNALHPQQNQEVPDPWYGTEAGYHDVFALIQNACTRIIEQYKPTQSYIA